VLNAAAFEPTERQHLGILDGDSIDFGYCCAFSNMLPSIELENDGKGSCAVDKLGSSMMLRSEILTNFKEYFEGADLLLYDREYRIPPYCLP
jgi:hypothetical protein